MMIRVAGRLQGHRLRARFLVVPCFASCVLIAGCAELGETWQKTGNEIEAFFESTSPGATPEEQNRARSAYERALGEQAAGDDEARAEHLREAAELGHPQAAYELGLAYMEGRGVAKDLELSATWINRAADLGDPGAEFLVGSSFYAGVGVDQDIPRGLMFLERAAEQGHPRAQFLLGQAYVDGIGVDANPEWAARWYGKAARGGHPQAQYAFGVMFESGLGLPKSSRRAYQWFDLAANNNYEKASVLRDALAEKLSPEELAAAKTMVARFSAKPSTGYTDAPTVMYVQSRLRSLGFDAGPLDGIAGAKTRAAIRAFQKSERLNVDGTLSRTLVEDLFARDPGVGA
jgi:localization factor PodJL